MDPAGKKALIRLVYFYKSALIPIIAMLTSYPLSVSLKSTHKQFSQGKCFHNDWTVPNLLSYWLSE